MRLPRDSVLVWFGLLGAPFAWVAQFLVGFGMTEAACGDDGLHRGIAVDGVTAAATALGAAITVLAILAAIKVRRDTSPVQGAGGAEEPPPRGRVHFLATLGIVIAPLFLFMMLMSGIGAIALPECNQS
jgi:hypothetical protein